MPSDKNIATDLELLASMKQGEHQAFDDIYNKYWYDLFKTAYKRLNDKARCQDVVQNVFTDLWNRRLELEIENLGAYLHTAARFQALKAISKSAKDSLFDIATLSINSGLRSDETLLNNEARQVVDLFIKALPAKRREIFTLHYLSGFSPVQIASQMGISKKTVQNQLTTASQALRLRLTHLFSLIAMFALLNR